MYEYESRVRYSETDRNGFLTTEAIIDQFQDIATFHSEDLGQGGVKMLKKGFAWVLCSWQIEINRYPIFGERLTVGTIPYEFRGFTGCRNCYMKDAEGKLAVISNSIWAFMDMNANRLVKVPDFVSNAYDTGPKLEMEYKPRRIIIPDEGGEVLQPVVAENRNLDLLGHVNNGQFVRIMQTNSRLNGQASGVKSIRVEYKAQAHAGDVLVPVRYEDKGKEIIVLKSVEGTVYTILEKLYEGAEQ